MNRDRNFRCARACEARGLGSPERHTLRAGEQGLILETNLIKLGPEGRTSRWISKGQPG